MDEVPAETAASTTSLAVGRAVSPALAAEASGMQSLELGARKKPLSCVDAYRGHPAEGWASHSAGAAALAAGCPPPDNGTDGRKTESVRGCALALH